MTRVKAVVIGTPAESAVFDDGYVTPVPAGSLFNGADLLSMIGGMLTAGEPLSPAPEGVLIIPDGWLSPQAGEAISDAGWRFTAPPPDEPTSNGWAAWTSFVRRDCIIHVGIRSLIQQDRTPLFDLGADAVVIARRLVEFQRVTGASFRKTPGVVGAALIRATYTDPRDGRQPLWLSSGPGGAVRGIGDLVWQRERTREERAMPYIHGYDVHGAYLSAATMADLAWTGLQREYLDPISFDPARAGFWRVRITPSPDRYPDPFAPPFVPPGRTLEDGTTWITTPTGRLLVDEGHKLEVADAWLAALFDASGRPGTRRLLRPWGEALRNARHEVAHQVFLSADRTAIRDTLKRVANEAIGMMSPTRGVGRIVRPDWAWTIRDLARANLTRKILVIGRQTGRWPVRVKTDAVYYTSRVADIGEAALSDLGITLAPDWAPGRWHNVSSTSADAWTDPHALPMGWQDDAEELLHGAVDVSDLADHW